MPTFNRDALRKGSAAIDAALEARRNGGGDRRAFLPNLFWKNDKDFRYLTFLNALEEIPEVEFHPFIDCDDGVPHMAFARTDPSIGDTSDPIQVQWGYKPRLTGLAMAVELEPTIELVAGRPKPTGFEVKMTEFERSIRDDEGKPTDEKEVVVAPVVGLVAQSPYNFFNQLRSFDATEAAINGTPLKITRLGQKENVTYNIVGYDTMTPDLNGLFEHIENLSYVTEPEELIASIEATSSTEEALTVIGEYLLYKRLEELADENHYNEILSKITKPAKYPDTKKDEKPERKVKPSQRRVESDTDTEEAETPKARTREPEAKVTKESPATARLEKLRKRSQQKKDTSE